MLVHIEMSVINNSHPAVHSGSEANTQVLSDLYESNQSMKRMKGCEMSFKPGLEVNGFISIKQHHNQN